MSRIRDNRGVRSDRFGSLNRFQSAQHHKGFKNHSSIPHPYNAVSSTTNANNDTRQQTSTIRSNSSIIRHYRDKNHSSNIRDSGRQPSSHEQTQYSSANNNSNRHHYAKRKSTTCVTESPPIKRLCLPPVSYDTLTKLCEKSSDDILAEMLDSNFQLKIFLNDQRMRETYDWIFSMTKLLEKMTHSTESREHIAMIFEQLPGTSYFEGVYDQVRELDPDTNQLHFQLIELFLEISKTFLGIMPHSADGLTKIFERIELQLTKNTSQSQECENVKEILNEVLEHVKEIEKQAQKRRELLNPKSSRNTNKMTTIDNDIDQPPNNYRQLPIVPNLIELLSEDKTYLRKNIVDGIYENAEQYLDIHFRLLREDFVAPLRDGIQQYLSKVPGKNFNIKIYENVHLLGSRLVPRNGLLYNLLLDRTIVSKIHWHTSQRLMHGNLLLLTYDNFRSCAFVTIEDRSQIEKTATISVKKFETSNIDERNQINLDKIDSSCIFTIIETTVYFEAYRPVLNALQKIPSDNNFPLAPFLLKLTNAMTPPDYITSTTTYDFTPLLVDPNSDVKAKLIVHDTTPFSLYKSEKIFTKKLRMNYKQSNQIETNYKTVSLLNKDQWPTSEQLHLNPKQYEALILALTNKVSLIQGPPGTGKTFLGVRITEMLLYNRSVWCPPDQQSTPILMVCHTNHALDQFLELIVNRLNIREGIIRLGSRCQNPVIQQFSLFNARQHAREQRSLPNDIHYQKLKTSIAKTEAEEGLKSQQHKMEMSQTKLISISLFVQHRIIDHRHYTSLLAPYYNGEIDDRALLEWLGLADDFEQISDQFIYKETNVLPMEINDYTEKHFDNDEDQFNDEEEDEQQRRQDEFDMEEYDDDPPSFVLRQPKIVSGNRTDRTNDKTASDREWQSKRKRPNVTDRSIRYIIQNSTTLNDQTVQQIHDNVWQLNEFERHDLYRYWLLKYREYLQDSISEKKIEYNQALSAVAEHRQEEEYHLIKDSFIVAMTTTCAAKYQSLLEKLQSKIVIVEEAAAIFESHIITALNTKCEHLILIGDHVQLRPNPSVYRLATRYNIDVSLFERLIKNNFPNVRLNIQHRMRPEIARLMKHFYDDLEDHRSVETDRAPVRGIDSNIFFINHRYIETTVDDGRSKRNEFEANYAIALAQYLIKQDYKPEQITILVMYLGQRQFIAKQAKQIERLRGIRIMVTDNYQGEENDIVILSLVRSNAEKEIGFLKIHNRICVALSRARCGFFVIGNMNLLAEVDQKWKEIIVSLMETNNIGKGLPLSCRQHPEPKFIADEPESFAQRREGGCNKICDSRLKCGHRCELMCHNYDLEHDDIVCHKTCDEQLSCGHLCTKRCHFETPNHHNPCVVPVEKTAPECGHQIRIECHKTPTSNACEKSSLKQLACNHRVDVPCRIISLPYELKQFPCPKPCGAILDCQHQCTGTCVACLTGKLHVACREKCDRELICSHVCRAACASDCPPCSRECQTRCVHSRCKKQCRELCIPCKEPCAYRCRHLQCTRRCSEPCNRDPCNEPCYKRLKCGHPCIGMCGEPCPRECRICNKDIVEDIFFGTEGEPNARFVFLPDCGHIIEVTALDKFIENFVDNRDDKTAIRFPECPRCKEKISRCTRYMSIINRVHHLISQVKKKILGDKTQQEMNYQRNQLIKKYEKIKTNLKEITLNVSMKNIFSVLYQEKRCFSVDMLNVRTNILDFLVEIDKLLIDGRQKLWVDIFEDLIHFPLHKIVKYLFTQRYDRNFAEQQLNDVQRELKRIRRIIYIESLVRSLKRTLEANEQEGIDSMRHLLNKPGPFTDQDRQKFDDLVKKYEYLNNLPGLGITEKERKAIVSALKLTKGHWYVCPNDHPYVITECGGANQESQCPTCGERIGGQNHQLLETNHHSSLMDGSQYAAWPNEANLNLHQPLL